MDLSKPVSVPLEESPIKVRMKAMNVPDQQDSVISSDNAKVDLYGYRLMKTDSLFSTCNLWEPLISKCRWVPIVMWKF